MANRTTNSGFVWQKYDINTCPLLQALLYDFDVNSAKLKPSHIKFLEDQARALDPGTTWNIRIEGRASRTGTAEHNLKLSKQRAEAVKAYITLVAPSAQLKPDWVGEALAERQGEKDGAENMFFRAVELVIWPEGKPLPAPMKHEPPKVEPTPPSPLKLFKIRVLRGQAMSLSSPMKNIPVYFSRDSYRLEIWDKEDNASAYYQYEGQGKGFDFGPKVSVSANFAEGPWNEFAAPRHVALDDFGGPAMFESVGASYALDSVGYTVFRFRPLHWYSIALGIKIHDFQMGRTVGVPGVQLGDSTGSLKYVGTEDQAP